MKKKRGCVSWGCLIGKIGCLSFLGIFLFLFLFLAEYRQFYSIDDDRIFTVWKNIGGKCYITPYKYYGLFPPSENYFIVSNLAYLDIFWSDTLPYKYIIRVDINENSLEIVNNDTEKYLLINYYEDEEKFRSTLFNEKGYLKQGKHIMGLDVKANRLLYMK